MSAGGGGWCGGGIESYPGYHCLEGGSWDISAKVSYVGDW